MDLLEVLSMFEQQENKSLKKAYSKFGFSKVYGLKITYLRNLAKKIGIDIDLSKKLSETDAYETMFLSILLEDEHTVTKNRLTDLAIKSRKSSIIDQALSDLVLKSNHIDILKDWHSHQDDSLRYAFYATYQAYLRRASLDDIDTTFGLDVLDHIKKTLLDEDIYIQNAMNNLVVMAGLHVPSLVDKAYEVAKHIGYVLPLKAKNSCNIQSALDYLNRYIDNPKYSRVAKLRQKK